jgi:hypothetical protein
MPFYVLTDGKRIGALRVNEHFNTSLEPPVSALQVSLEGAVSSPAFRLPSGTHVRSLECGNPLRVAFDLLSLCYLPPLRARAIYLRETSDASSKASGP